MNGELVSIETLKRIKELEDENKELKDMIAIDSRKYWQNRCGINAGKRLILEQRWEKFKTWIQEYEYKKTGGEDTGRYCVAISVKDLLEKIEELEEID